MAPMTTQQEWWEQTLEAAKRRHPQQFEAMDRIDEPTQALLGATPGSGVLFGKAEEDAYRHAASYGVSPRTAALPVESPIEGDTATYLSAFVARLDEHADREVPGWRDARPDREWTPWALELFGPVKVGDIGRG